jgi:ABC-2 type transport system permease protein
MSTPETNFSAADTGVMDAPQNAAVAHRISTLNVLMVLVRREFWEHRALWISPLVVVALITLGGIFLNHKVMEPDSHAEGFETLPITAQLLAAQMGVTVPLAIVSLIVLSFYLLDCLYLERKDRSILFWKSLPVSDATTVASKLIVALLAVPVGIYVLALIQSWILVALLSFSIGHAPVSLWSDAGEWLKAELSVLLVLSVEILWIAPIAGYLILFSAWARRNVFLWATLPPVIGVVAERMVFGTHTILSLISYRTLGSPASGALDGVVKKVSHGVGSPFNMAHIGQAFLNIDVWLGLAVAAAFAFAAVRIRRYRDDT